MNSIDAVSHPGQMTTAERILLYLVFFANGVIVSKNYCILKGSVTKNVLDSLDWLRDNQLLFETLDPQTNDCTSMMTFPPESVWTMTGS